MLLGKISPFLEFRRMVPLWTGAGTSHLSIAGAWLVLPGVFSKFLILPINTKGSRLSEFVFSDATDFISACLVSYSSSHTHSSLV